MKKAILTAGVAALTFAACGGGDSDQDKVAAVLLAEAEQDGLNADEDCVRDVAASLSDEDAQKILAIEEDDDIEDAGLSDAGFSQALGVLNCVDVTQFIDEAIAELQTSGVDFDEQCVRDAFVGVDFSEFTADGGIPEDLTNKMIACIGG